MAFPRHLTGLVLAAFAFAAAGAAACAQEPVDFIRGVRPILLDHCYQCHGPDAAQRKADLRLDLAAAAMNALPTGKRAVVPGDPSASELWQRISSANADERMPPADGKPLTSNQKVILKRWIERGARWPQHWSLAPPGRSPLPQRPMELRTWPRNAIDLFIARRLMDERLSPSPQADRLTLLRRLALDITGIGPSPDDIERHMADQ